MSQSAYSNLKAAWHLDRIEDLRAGRRTNPVELQLILSDYCNHDCHFCAYRASNGLSTERFVEGDNHNPKRMLTKEKALEILDDAAEAGIKSVIFTGGGEPTAHPNHLEIFDYALKLGLECSLNTNGVVFKKGWENILPRFTYIRFSIDASGPEEYAEVRNCPATHYAKMMGNLQSLVETVYLEGTACVVGTGYVVTPFNYMNVREGVERIKATGASYVRLAAMQSTDEKDAYEGKWDLAREAALSVQEHACEGFDVYDLMDGVIGERPDYQFCGFQHFVLYIGANLECYRCCYTAYTDHGLVGSLKDQRLSEYLKTRDLSDFDARSCDVCPLNDKNRVIDYLTRKAPLHVNFV